MYSSLGQLAKGKPAKAPGLINHDARQASKAATSASRIDSKDTKKRQRSPTISSEQDTQVGESDATGCLNGEDEQRKQNGRPVTWIGGGGLDMKDLASLGVPRLREIFLTTFGHHTASNNGGWLRRKLAEPANGGRGRALQIRARDASAAIWTTGKVKGVTKAEAAAIAAQRQAQKQAEQSLSGVEPGSRSTRNGPLLLPGGLTPSRAPPPQATASARVTRLFKDELPCGQKTYVTRSTPVPRDTELFGNAVEQPGSRRLIMTRSNLRNKGSMLNLAVELLWQDDGEWWPARITQVDTSSVSVEYDNGDRETLSTSEVLRDGLLSLGWVQPQLSSELLDHPSSDAGSVCDHAQMLERSQEPDENIHGLVCFEKACNVNSPQIQDNFDVIPPSSKKAKLDIPALDLFSPPVSRLRSESVTSTPSALLPAPVPQPNTPLDPDTCLWADACLATAHRPTPAVGRTLNLTRPVASAGVHATSASQLPSKSRAELAYVGSHVTTSGPSSSAKTCFQSPSLLSRVKKAGASATERPPSTTAVTLGFMSPPMRVPVGGKSKLSTAAGLTSPLGRNPVDSHSNTSSVASAHVPANAAAYDPAPVSALPSAFPAAAATQFKSGKVQQNQQQPYPAGHLTGQPAAVSQQGRAIAQLPSFAAAFGSMFSPPARAVSFSPAAKQSSCVQPYEQGMFGQPLGQGSLAHTAAQGLPNSVHNTLQPYAQASLSRHLPLAYMAPQRFAEHIPGSYAAHNKFVPPHHVAGHAAQVSTLDMLLGTDKLRNMHGSELHLPIGAVQVPSTSVALQAALPSFIDSVTAFADGFALPGPREQPCCGWGSHSGVYDRAAIASPCAMDVVEFLDADAAAIKMHELSEDGTLSCFDGDQIACES